MLGILRPDSVQGIDSQDQQPRPELQPPNHPNILSILFIYAN